jgi:hypothetical protein
MEFYGFHVDCSMESIWNSTWICNVNSLEIPWNPHGPVHGIHMECTIPWTFHMDFIGTWNEKMAGLLAKK